MDCRRPLFLSLLLCASLTGCFPSATTPKQPSQASQPSPPIGSFADWASDPKRHPQASTYVSFGWLHEQNAADPKRSDTDRDASLGLALSSYQQALALDSKCIPAMAGVGRVLSAKGDYARAESYYRKALEAHPKAAALWYGLGMCHGRQKEWQEACRCLTQATELDPDNKQYGNAYGFLLVRVGRPDDALAAFRKVDGEAEAHLNLARMLHHVQQTDLSREHARKALAIDPRLEAANKLLDVLEQPAAPEPRTTLPVDYDVPTAAPEQG